VSKSIARRATQSLKLRRQKTTVIRVLQPRDPAKIFFFTFSAIVEGKIDPQLIFFCEV
jgi:hypothetical protein